MDEYISREMAVKKLQMQLLNLEADQDKGEYSELCENRGARDALDEAIYDIRTIKAADVQPVDRWISVDDKLPDSDTTVLVWYTADSLFGRFGDYGVTHYRESSGWSKASLIGDDQAIFYWMPLPEPPKEGEY